MRIVVWNARSAFSRKAAALAGLRPDIAVIPECRRVTEASPGCSVWVGAIPSKGLAIMSYGHYRVTLAPDHEEEIRWAAPVLVTGPHSFFLLAIWEQRPYGTGVQRALARYGDLIKDGAAVVAGDFNQNANWDRAGRARNHTRTVQMLGDLGLVSSYHHHFGEAQGKEALPTYWHSPTRKALGFHIDYCFVPKQ